MWIRRIWLVAMLGVGCGGDDGPHNDGGNSPQLKTNLGIDLSSIKGFVIAPVTVPGAVVAVADTTVDQLWTLNADGSLTIVTVTTTIDGDGMSTSTDSQRAVPRGLFDTPSYTLIAFDHVGYQMDSCTIVAVRKSDAALFCVTVQPSLPVPPPYYPTVGAAASGQYVTIHGEPNEIPTMGPRGGLVALDFSGATPVRKVVIDPALDGLVGPSATNSAGDVFLRVSPVGGTPATRVYSRGGGFTNHDPDIDCLIAGTGADAANFYFTKNRTPGGVFMATLFKLTKNGTTFDQTEVFDDVNGTVGIRQCSLGNVTADVVESGDKIYVTTPGASMLGHPPPYNYFVELVNGGIPVRHTAAAMDEITMLVGYSTGIVVVGRVNNNNIMQRWSGGGFTTVLAPGEYSVSIVSASRTGEITFSGRRMSDNARIIGNIPAGSSTVTIVPQTFSGDVVQIQRIN